ncbi:hypothetical protein Q5752_005892 [Cryptotrichosporon argae]
MTTSLGTLTRLLPLSACIAFTGLSLPIALSFLLCPLFGFAPVHAFAAGSALSSTSLGTTLGVLSAARSGPALARSALGTALLGAAVMDDVVAFVLSEILAVVGGGAGNVGAYVGRTIGVTLALGIAAVPLTRYALGPVYVRYWNHPRVRRGEDGVTVLLLALVFLGSLAAAGYAGTSPLYGVYLGGLAVSHLGELEPRPYRRADLVDQSRDTSDLHRSRSLPCSPAPADPVPPARTPQAAFARIVAPVLHRLLVGIFFGSIGYSIPFIPLWRGRIIWRGIVYALLMALAKAVCGAWLCIWPTPKGPETAAARAKERLWAGLFVGSAMVARGEIGLLTSQIAYHTGKPLLEEDDFLITTWAIVLCTVAGPLSVGAILRRKGLGVLAGG